ENALERASVLCDDALIKLADLPPAVRNFAVSNGEAEGEIFSPAPSGENAPQIFTNPNSPGRPSSLPLNQMPLLKNYLREQEVAYLNRVLAHTDSDKEKTAELLGISVATLYRKLSEEEPVV
ncbi:MAG: helix-turn-helix domain-containing protein, partial [Verrucomicrobiota bacterium]